MEQDLRRLARSSARLDPGLAKMLGAFHGSPAPTAPGSLPVEALTDRELEVLRLLCQGLSNQEIAAHLVISLYTVKKHNYSLFQKLGVPNRAQAILKARELFSHLEHRLADLFPGSLLVKGYVVNRLAVTYHWCGMLGILTGMTGSVQRSKCASGAPG